MTALDVSLRALGRQTLLYGLSFAISRAASFVMLPIYTRYLTPVDYGVLNLVQITLDVAAILLSAGIVTGLFRFYVKSESPTAKAQLVTSTFYLLAGFNLLAALLLFGAAPSIATVLLDGPQSASLVRLAALAVAFEALTIVPMLLAQVRQRALFYLVASSSRLVLQIGLNLLFVVVLDRSVEGVLLSTLLTNALLGSVLAAWMFRQTGLRTDSGAALELLRFGLPYRVTQAGTFLLTFGDRYFLKAFHDLTTIGIYTLAYQFGFLVMYAAAIPFLQAWNPQRFEIAKLPPGQRDERYNRGLHYFGLAVLTVAVTICLFVTPMLEVMSDPAFRPAARLVPILVAAYALQAFTDVVELGIQVSERTRFATYATWLAVALILVLYALWIPALGALGAALATLVTFAARFTFFYAFSHRVWPIAYRWGSVLRLASYGALAVGVREFLRPSDLLAQLALGAMLLVGFALLAWFGGGLPRSEREELVRLVRQRLSLATRSART